MNNENEKKENRWFLIEHEKCGSILTIKSNKYPDKPVKPVQSNVPPDPECAPLVCPSCPDIRTGDIDEKLIPFLATYKNLSESLKIRHFTIREIQFEDLKVIKSLLKNPLRALFKPQE